jgi:hypothetical protein
MNVPWSLYTVPVILVSFSKNTQIYNFMKTLPVGEELFHADRRTEEMKLIVAFRNCTNAPKKLWQAVRSFGLLDILLHLHILFNILTSLIYSFTCFLHIRFLQLYATTCLGKAAPPAGLCGVFAILSNTRPFLI